MKIKSMFLIHVNNSTVLNSHFLKQGFHHMAGPPLSQSLEGKWSQVMIVVKSVNTSLGNWLFHPVAVYCPAPALAQKINLDSLKQVG